jgi:hypothetical protein
VRIGRRFDPRILQGSGRRKFVLFRSVGPIPSAFAVFHVGSLANRSVTITPAFGPDNEVQPGCNTSSEPYAITPILFWHLRVWTL